MSDPLDLLRATVETEFVRRGIPVLDIVTRDLDMDAGETEWIVGTFGRHWTLLLSNSVGVMLGGLDHEKAMALISLEVERLRLRMDESAAVAK